MKLLPKFHAVVLGLVCASELSAQTSPSVTERDDTARAGVVFLLRHAEPTFPPYDTDPPDPALNEAGGTRAGQLAHILRDAGVTRILSTDFRRTRETAAPLARSLALEIELYDPGDLGQLAEELRQHRGRTLVVGHGRSTHELVELLGGDPGTSIESSTEFDRLYTVVISGSGVTTLLLRFGAEY